MTTQLAGWDRIVNDNGTAAEVAFQVSHDLRIKLRGVGLWPTFEMEVLRAIAIVRDEEAIGIAEAQPEFELPQGPDEGLPGLYWLQRHPSDGSLLVRPLEQFDD